MLNKFLGGSRVSLHKECVKEMFVLDRVAQLANALSKYGSEVVYARCNVTETLYCDKNGV